MSQFFKRMAATENRILGRSCESLLGIVTGMLSDDHLSDDEIRFLDVWLADHSELAGTWPGEVIVATVREVLADGAIEETEREHLKQTLSALIGGTLQTTGATSGGATTLPLDEVGQIEIEGHLFCFTGAFHFGTRAACMRAIEKRNGMAVPRVRKDLNYLVIGELASRDWAHTSHGRKIEKAMHFKSKGRPILIIGEDVWVQAL